MGPPPQAPCLPCGLCPSLQALSGSQGGSHSATSHNPEPCQLPSFLHSSADHLLEPRETSTWTPFLSRPQVDLMGPEAYVLLEAYFEEEY